MSTDPNATARKRTQLSYEQYASLREWSLEHIEELRNLKAAEHTAKAIEALGFGISISTVRDLRQANNIQPIEVPAPDLMQLVLELRERVCRLEQIAGTPLETANPQEPETNEEDPTFPLH